MDKMIRMDDLNITLEQIKKEAADRAFEINGTVMVCALDLNDVIGMDLYIFRAADENPDNLSERWLLASDDFTELIMPDIVMALAARGCA